MKGAPRPDLEWEPTRDFVDPDVKMTQALEKYLHQHNLNVSCAFIDEDINSCDSQDPVQCTKHPTCSLHVPNN